MNTTHKHFSQEWIDAWNSHDLEKILSHYADDIVLTSPVAAKLCQDPSGIVKGKTALTAYFKKGLEVYPDLRFTLLDELWGVDSVVLYYVNQNQTKTAELMQFDIDGKVIKVVANYNKPA